MMLKALENCRSHSFNFTNYKRNFLRPDDWLMANYLNSGLNAKVRGTLRGKRLFTKNLDEAFEKAKSEGNIEELAEANAIFHEVLFLVGQKENATNESDMKRYAIVAVEGEKVKEIRSSFELTLSIVEANDIGDLRELQQSRNHFLDRLPLDQDWTKRVFVNGYCEGLLTSCVVASGVEIEMEEVLKLVMSYKRTQTGLCGAGEQKVRSMIRAYAFVIDSLDKKREINIEFVQQIHAQAYEQNEEMLEEGDKFGGRIVREGLRLKTLLEWLDLHFIDNDIDPVTLAAIGHYGIFLLQPFIDGNHRCGRLLQDFILMHFGYPPACIFDNDIGKYLEKAEEARNCEGADLRPFLRFISAKCMPKTFEALLHKNVDIDLGPAPSSTNSLEGGRVGSLKNSPLSFKPPYPEVYIRDDSFTEAHSAVTSSLGSIQPSFASSKGSTGQPIHGTDPIHVLSAHSSPATGDKIGETEKAEEDKEESNSAKNLSFGAILKMALAGINPELVEIEELPSSVEIPQSSGVYDGQEGGGWSAIFKGVLGAFNPELLHFD